MSDETRRIIIKTGAGAPTIPASNDHRDGTWITTDIYIGENYLDTTNNIFYHRNATGIIPEVSSTELNSVFITGKNTTGSTINKGDIVYVSGASGQFPSITLAQSDVEATSFQIGVASFDILNNTNVENNVTVTGLLIDFDTSSFNDGDILYLSSTVAGGIVNVAPTTPNFVNTIGFCLYSHPNNGKILISTSTPKATNTTISTSNRVSPTSNAVKVNLDLKAPIASPSFTGTVIFPPYTTANRNAISSPSVGMTVYNTDRNRIEWYDGQVWLNQDLVKRQNKSGGTLLVGNPVYQNSTFTEGVSISASLDFIAMYGFVVDGDLATDGWCTIAVAGDYDVLFSTASVSRNALVLQSATSGQAYSTGTPSPGVLAITKGSKSAGATGLVKCWVHKMDTY